MKFSLVALSAMVAFATVNCYPQAAIGEGPLYEDIQYFLDMIPKGDVMEVVVQYTIKDSEFQQLVKYVKTDDFKQMLQEIEAIPEFHTFANYMEKHGIYMYDALNKMNRLVGLPSFQPMLVKRQIRGGLKGFFNDVKELISYDDIIHGYVYKMRTSEAFRDFIAELKSESHQNFVNALYKNQRWLAFRASMVNKGLDITLIEDVIYTVLGIEFPVLDTSSTMALYDNKLSEDLRDFMDLVDMDKVIQIISSYLDDDQVQETIRYVRGEEFHVLVRKVEALKPYQNLVKTLNNSGLDIYGRIQRLHKLINMEDYVPPTYFSFYVNRGGVKGLIDEVLDTIPVDKFKALFQEKMQSSPVFKNFVETLQSQEFQQIVDTIYSEPIFLEMRQKAIDVGLDLTRARAIFDDVGIKLPRPSGYFY